MDSDSSGLMVHGGAGLYQLVIAGLNLYIQSCRINLPLSDVTARSLVHQRGHTVGVIDSILLWTGAVC